MLSKGAFNALLKTLEEPPAHVVFIFATTEPQRIPDTVLSRVQRFDFKRIPVGVVAERLKLICDAEGVAFSESSLRMIARAGEGSMRDAQSLLDQVIAFAGESAEDDEVAQILGLVDRSLLYQMLEGLLQAEPTRSLEAIATVYEHGYELSQFTSELLELIRNAALASLSPSSKPFLDITEDERNRLLELSKGVSPEVFSQYFDVLMQVHDRVARSSRPRLVLEMAVARLASTRAVEPVGALMARLESLEKRLRTSGVQALPARAHTARGTSQSPRVAPPAPAPEPPRAASPAPVLEEAPVEEKVVPIVSADASAPERYRAFVEHLRTQGVRYRTISESSVLLGFESGILDLGFVSERTLKRGGSLCAEAEVLRFGQIFFGDLKRIRARLRPEDATLLTAKESHAKEQAELAQSLVDETHADPLIQELTERLEGEVETVKPLEN